jgi:hypothetical protein
MGEAGSLQIVNLVRDILVYRVEHGQIISETNKISQLRIIENHSLKVRVIDGKLVIQIEYRLLIIKSVVPVYRGGLPVHRHCKILEYLQTICPNLVIL